MTETPIADPLSWEEARRNKPAVVVVGVCVLMWIGATALALWTVVDRYRLFYDGKSAEAEVTAVGGLDHMDYRFTTDSGQVIHGGAAARLNKVGQRITIVYLPSNPADNVPQADLKFDLIAMTVMLPILALGPHVVVWVVRVQRKRRRSHG
jgi:hypothetical protein